MFSVDRPQDEAGYRNLLAHLPHSAAGEVENAMRQPHRHYHAPWHLGRMWRLHCQHKADAWSNEIMWAIAYHDIVYEAQHAPKQNEFESAARFLKAARLGGVSLEAASRIASWILASADHLGAGSFILPAYDPAGAWFLDLDLEPLASDEFAQNTAMIREEFQHVSDEAFQHGRGVFLAGILKAPAIFRTDDALRLGWEAAARHNIAGDLNRGCLAES